MDLGSGSQGVYGTQGTPRKKPMAYKKSRKTKRVTRTTKTYKRSRSASRAPSNKSYKRRKTSSGSRQIASTAFSDVCYSSVKPMQRIGRYAKMLATLCPRHLSLMGTQRVTASIGTQVQSAWPMFSNSGGIPTVAPATNFLSDIQNMYWAGFLSTVPAGQHSDQRIFIEKGVLTLTITNADQIPAMVTIYDTVTRQNCDANTSTQWSNGLVSGSLTNGTVSPTALGVTPFMSPMFTNTYKVLKSLDVVIPPGQTYKHTMICSPKYLMDMNDNFPASSSDTYKSYLTHEVMLNCRGTPTNDATTKTAISTSAVALNVVAHKVLTYKMFVTDTVSYKVLNTLGTIATASFINQNTGDVDITDVQA